MLTFKKITISDKQIIQNYTLTSPKRNCDWAFNNLCSWQFLFKTEYAVINQQLVIRYHMNDKPYYTLLVDTPDKDWASIVDMLIIDSQTFNAPLRIQGLDEASKEILDKALPNRFSWRTKREFADYIYLRSDLTALMGKKFQPKRNHINQFLRAYPDFEYVPITPDIIEECLQLEWLWQSNHSDSNEFIALDAERRSLTFALNHFNELDLTGGALRVEGRVIAFTFGAPINGNTFDICIEKADTNFIGSYAMINHEFASRLSEQFEFINREEDLGIEGLRKAKLSYQPVEILNKYIGKIELTN